MNDKSKIFLKKLIWEKYFRHYGPETKVWKNKQCISLSERLRKLGYTQPPSPRTLYNFSKTGKASAYTLSTLVHAVYNDNSAFMAFFNSEYQGNDKLKWEAFADFTSWQFKPQAPEETSARENAPDTAPIKLSISDPSLFIYRVFGGSFTPLFTFYFFIYCVVVLSLAVATGVWKGIDYPLSESYSVWIGYLFFASAATFITLFNKNLFRLLNFTNGNTEVLKKRLTSVKVSLILLILAVTISSALHYTFLTDQLHGWCESEPGKLSWLGFYHLVLYAFNLWIIFLFIYYYTNVGKIIKSLAETETNNEIGYCKNIKAILPVLSNLNIYYKLIVIAIGGFAMLFFATIILFMKKNHDYTLYLWQWVEIGILIILYVGFGFVLYWRYFAKSISNFLIAERNKQLLKNYMNQQEMIYSLTLPSGPDEINQYAANILNIIIWIVSIGLLLLIGSMLYLSN